ncbi:MAG: hypothetical protein KKF88_01250 [Alphaproteobacteria bacterium]|nr:hypothetical protein [Alphaproteobacteria bacterium]
MSLALHRLDRRYVWRAISTIAVEDVGIGAADAVLWATAAQRAGFRKAVGELPLLIALIRRMATAVKSRSAIELAFVTDTGEPEMFRLFGGMTTGQLLDRFAGSDPYEAYAALSVLRGIVPKAYRIRPPDQRGVAAAGEMLTGQMDPALVRAARAALYNPLDEMSLGFAVAARLPHDDNAHQDIMPESRLIDGYPAETFDQHERLGRQAIDHFAKSLSRRSPALAALPAGKARAAVADAVFVVEGQCLDRWLGGPDFDRLRGEADGYSLTRHGLSAEAGREVRQLIRSSLADLHATRCMMVADAE